MGKGGLIFNPPRSAIFRNSFISFLHNSRYMRLFRRHNRIEGVRFLRPGITIGASLRDFKRTVKRKSKLLIRNDLGDSRKARAACVQPENLGESSGEAGLARSWKSVVHGESIGRMTHHKGWDKEDFVRIRGSSERVLRNMQEVFCFLKPCR
jgi:hypothetical protein